MLASMLLVAVTVTAPPVTGVVSTALFPSALIVPPDVVHVTDVLALPVTDALNETVAPASAAAESGVTDTAAELTVTVADADLLASAELVAVTVTVPPVAGAVRTALLPFPAIVPAEALHVTDVFELPVTVALNETVPPASAVADDGEMLTATGTGGAVTVTDADALLDGSSTLVALTV